MTPPSSTTQKEPLAAMALSPAERGLAASRVMGKELKAEHKRWDMPLLAWKNGRVVKVKN